ncbi:hypothetical protein GOODEAATRI_013331 [Goodea atripinnis]|uniref:Secreted protein n=1 Tax=Goodea atripinnis TaxID=208336 RepID=A0ABV0NUC3_9TELE
MRKKLTLISHIFSSVSLVATAITPRAHRCLIQEVEKEPRTTSNIIIHMRVSRPKQHKGQTHICQKTFGQIFPGRMRQKYNFLQRYVKITNAAFQKNEIILTVKHGGGSVMAWGFIAS